MFSQKRSKLMTLVGLIAFGAVLTVVFLGFTVEKYNDDMKCFLGMCTDADGKYMSLEDYKRQNADKEKLAAQEEDAASQNRYGTVTLSYHPPTAQVRVRQLVLEQDGLAGTRNWKAPENFKKSATASASENQEACEKAGGYWIRDKEKCAQATEIELGSECTKDSDCYSKDLFDVYEKNLTIELIAEATEKKRAELMDAARLKAKGTGGILSPEVLDSLDAELKTMKDSIAREVSTQVGPRVAKAKDMLKGVAKSKKASNFAKIRRPS